MAMASAMISGGVTGEIHYVDSGYNIISMPRPEAMREPLVEDAVAAQ